MGRGRAQRPVSSPGIKPRTSGNRSSHQRHQSPPTPQQSRRPEACIPLKKTLAQMFSCELCQISKNIFFTEHPWTTASVVKKNIKADLLSCPVFLDFLILCHKFSPTLSAYSSYSPANFNILSILISFISSKSFQNL